MALKARFEANATAYVPCVCLLPHHVHAQNSVAMQAPDLQHMLQVRGLVFEADESAVLLAPAVAAACQRLTAANIPHNLFVVDCGQRVFLFPNAFAGAKAAGCVPQDLLDTMVDPAGFEICGHIIMKRQEDYDGLSQASIWRLLEYASFSEEEFEKFILLALDL